MSDTNIRRGATTTVLRSTRNRVIAVVAALCLAITATTISSQTASAADYPTWQDVANARSNQAATAAAVDQPRLAENGYPRMEL